MSDDNTGKGIILFEEKHVRREWDDERKEWRFSVSDVVTILTDSTDVKQYIKKMRSRDSELNSRWGTICTLTAMIAADGKKYRTTAANAEGILRIIQSIPSPKAEPFKRWLARVGYERMQEIENPELSAKRMRDTYLAKGYPEDWIALRMRGIATRETLTDEWNSRGVDESKEYAILTAEISKAAFGMTPSEYRKFKGLSKGGDNLRDHMNDLELIFSQLSEAATTEIARNDDAQGFFENKNAARRGGKIAGDARRDLESQTGRRVSTKDNYKHLTESKKRKSLKPKKSDE